jgi:uncharacterized protein (DUF2147 family)
MRSLLSLTLVLATARLLPAAAMASPASAPVFGAWRTPAGSVVDVEPCRSSDPASVCLRVLDLPPDAPAKVDIHNPNPSLRDRALCGLVIGTGFHADDPMHLSGGLLYDPKSGHTYKGSVASEGDTLKLHGYVGFSVFGRTETWHRAAGTKPCR